jgi:hypothetical protein
MKMISSRRHVCFAVFFTLLVALARAAAPSANSWQVGTGREIITPPAGVWMTGYAARSRPADGTAQDLWVKALAFADPAGQRGVLITLDLCGITQEITARVCAQLEQKHHLPRAAVMINVSHTHCSPWFEGSIIGLRILPADGLAKADAYRRDLEQKIIRAADHALSHLAPAAMAWGEDSANFGVNRRENPEKEIPARRAAGTAQAPGARRVLQAGQLLHGRAGKRASERVSERASACAAGSRGQLVAAGKSAVRLGTRPRQRQAARRCQSGRDTARHERGVPAWSPRKSAHRPVPPRQ